MQQQSMSSSSSSYRPQIQTRTTLIQRTGGSRSSSLGGGGYGFMSRSSMGPTFSSGTYQQLSSSGVANVRDSRQKEKKEMQVLNERFATYIEKVRYLEAIIKQHEATINELLARESFDIQPIRDMYEAELAQARRVIDELSKEKAGVDAKMAGLQDEVQRQQGLIDLYEKHKVDYVSKINQLTTQVGEYEGELGSLRLRIRNMEDENDKLRELLSRCNDDLKKMRADLDCETAAHIEASNRAQTFEEECEFLRALLDKFPKEKPITKIQGMDMKAWWEKELAGCIKDLQNEYDSIVSTMRDDMQMRMDGQLRQLQSGALKENLESAHLREEVKKLKSQLGDKNSANMDSEARIRQLESELNQLRMTHGEMCSEFDELKVKYQSDMDRLNSELEACLQELQCIMDAKLSLELEIACYRQLLEGEENRAGLKQVVEQAVGVQSSGASKLTEFITSGGQSSMSSEASGRMTQSRSSRGNVSFVQCSFDGSFIEFENNTTGSKSKTQQLKGWHLKRSTPGKPECCYDFDNYELKPGQKLRVYGYGNPPAKGQNVGCDYIISKDIFSWGGGTGTCVLEDEAHTSKAELKSNISSLR